MVRTIRARAPAGVREIAVAVLADAEGRQGLVADLASGAADRERLSARDAASLTRLVLEATRRRATLDAVAEAYAGRRAGDFDKVSRQALRVGIFELVYSRGVPPYAAASGAVEAAKILGGRRAAGFCNAVLRKVASGVRRVEAASESGPGALPLEDGGAALFDRDVFPPASRAIDHLASVFSHQPWTVERWMGLFGERGARRILAEDNRVPPLTARLRGSHAEREALRSRLEAEGRVSSPGRYADVLILASGSRPGSITGFAEGALTVQDETSSGPARALGARPGERVLDLCAAPGGKSVQIADDVGGDGFIAAVEADRGRIRRLKETLARTGARCVFPVVADGTRLPFREAAFDRAIVDAPCSNSGVFRRRVEARWRVSPAALRELPGLQGLLVRSAASAIRLGGRLVYSTCSIEPVENQEVTAALAADRPEFRVVEEERVLPGAADGGYWAVFQRGA